MGEIAIPITARASMLLGAYRNRRDTEQSRVDIAQLRRNYSISKLLGKDTENVIAQFYATNYKTSVQGFKEARQDMRFYRPKLVQYSADNVSQAGYVDTDDYIVIHFEEWYISEAMSYLWVAYSHEIDTLFITSDIV